MKNVYGNLYFALEALQEVPDDIKQLYEKGISLIAFHYTHNLVKIDRDRLSITLLNYPHLHTHAHPYLKDSMKIFLDAENKYKLKRESTSNPVILHRIELMLSKNNKRVDDLMSLTRIEEEMGLYDDKNIMRIGRREYWNACCRNLNLITSLSPEDNLSPVQLGLFGAEISSINREKTAMGTKKPSAPTKILWSKNMIVGKVFDWGCGKGRDSSFLTQKGFQVISYDKYYQPTPLPSEIDFSEINTILLNYVLNVIENPSERMQLLNDMLTFGKRGSTVLVSVRSQREIEGFAKNSNWKPFNDGFITSRSTFQKGFVASELENILRDFVEIIELADNGSYIYCVGNLKKL